MNGICTILHPTVPKIRNSQNAEWKWNARRISFQHSVNC